MPQYDSLDDLYGKVAANKPGLTKDQFLTDMRDPQKASKLYRNIKSNNAAPLPNSFGEFVNYYGFNKPVEKPQATPKQPSPQQETAPSQTYPELVQQAQQIDLDQQKTKDVTDAALIKSGIFKKDENGNLVRTSPMIVDPNKEWQNKADDTFEGMADKDVKGYDKSIIPLIRSYYGTKDKAERNTYESMIKEINPDWQPFTDEQWQKLNDAKVNVYQSYLMTDSNIEYDANAGYKAMMDKAGNDPAVMGDAQTIAKQQAATQKENNSQFYKDYANVLYRGQGSVKDPSYFWSTVWNSAKQSVGAGSTKTGKDYNNELSSVFNSIGIPLTEDQKNDVAEGTWDKVKEVSGGVVGMVLPMVAGQYAGETVNVEKVASKLASSDNAFVAFGGRTLRNSFTNVLGMEAANYAHPMQAAVQGLSFAATDAAMAKLGIKATDKLGQIFGSYLAKATVKSGTGVVSGLASNAADNYFTMAKDYLQGSDDFKKQMGKENPNAWDALLPTTKDAVANVAAMGMFGFFHGAMDLGSAYQDLKKNGFNKLAEDAKTEYAEVMANQKNNEDAIKTITSKQGNPKMPVPLDQKGNTIVKTDNSVTVPREEKQIENIDRKSPSETKAITQNFTNEDDLNAFKRKSIMRGLSVKTFDLSDESGENKGHTAIAYDKNFEPMTNRIHELLVKENNGTITTDEIPELASLEGQDPKMVLSELSKKAPNADIKEKYDSKLNDIIDKTENGYGAYNEIAQLNKQIKEAKENGQNTQDLENAAAIEARKYGFKIHYGDKGLEIVDNKKNVIGTEPKINPDNANEIEEMFQSGESIDKLNELGKRDGLQFTEDEDGGIVGKFQDKVIAKTNAKGLNDYENPLLPKMLNAIKNAKDISIEGMTKEDIGDALHDIDSHIKSPKSEMLLDAADEMLNKGEVNTSTGKIKSDVFIKTSTKPSPESLAYKKTSSVASNISKDAIDPHTLEKKFTKRGPMFKDMDLEDLKKLDTEKLSEKEKGILKNVIKSKERIAEKPLEESNFKETPIEYKGEKYVVKEDEEGNKSVFTDKGSELASVNPKKAEILAEASKKKRK